MKNGESCAQDDYVRICLEGVAKIDTTKISRFVADDWSVRTAYFFEVTNKRDSEFHFGQGQFRIRSQDGSKAGIEQFVFFRELPLPDGWQTAGDSIPPSETVKLFVIPEKHLGDQKPESIRYDAKLAEAWYNSIKSDSDDHIANYAGERIQIKITPSTRLWRQIKMNMQ
jgi:hypothetical protein